ncbi:hypothetical protein QRQ56_36820 [Bradyrhizobium sp. U531]|uniref:hypothetical protein n=1 Tax=Bradyrhizobium sp. U531 TaxID=3053458 RepID=UPI003F438C63
MKAEKSITVTAYPQSENWWEPISCLAQFASRVQRCLHLHPGILDAAACCPIQGIRWPNTDHSLENLVPLLPCSYANDNQPIEFPYQRN